ncbi:MULTISPECIES: DUF397 domain-containing protein [unclassified Streptomyces]|uniref:DUF397 domain-containing protein n=1 Tax=unclassified Streptomyces TaxID=2593676 RepID=UPI002256C7D0|nr:MULTISPECIES: DUF397 domain-containing protein [unclassified Streptomyces]WSP56837.1 DUF397 domain-containing protein [Streptomyces sp. NBC_01241]WSU22445.1 DUF397 domain-containing protein [Streptomyces sp. NBC_01108]MCX4788615.1 DUF397 domain-containing protein [Streptomyces sp. NBC_01221]MCX4795637.1 DUF397 domain-containing protein [Streptomyces sp. NBC_01242]WSJ36936.1 DUF397 domain-containing protein [Streptomyces sp. NBC_01321]
MPTSIWQKSSYCGEGDACIYICAFPSGTIGLTESGDPSGATLRTAPATLAALLHTLKKDTLHG